MIARPRATSSRTNSGVISASAFAPKAAAPNAWPGCWRPIIAASFAPFGPLAFRFSRYSARRWFSRIAIFHLRRDDALTRVVHLRDVLARLRAARIAVQAGKRRSAVAGSAARSRP
jgi:hypothetical protein